MSDATTKTFPHLTPVAPTRDRMLSCDLCYACEHDDIVAALVPFTAALRPMYEDARDGILVCQRCAEAGDYLVIETCGPEVAR